MLAIIDYGMGNLYSVKNALDFLEIESVISSDPEVLEVADGLILPGVGAFPDAMETLESKGLAKLVVRMAKEGKPLMGICLGMQLLLDESEEVRPCRGLGLISGKCIKMKPEGLKIPHIGWNDITISDKACPILEGIADGSYVYFVHSFRADFDKDNEGSIAAYTQYGEKVPAVISNGKNVFGAQFPPEKSEKTGLAMLKNFNDFVNTRRTL